MFIKLKYSIQKHLDVVCYIHDENILRVVYNYPLL